MAEHISVTGDKPTVEQLKTLMFKLDDLRIFWGQHVAPMHIRWMASQFETEGGFAGRPWAPLSPTYAAWKSLHAPGRGILYFAGGIRQAASKPKHIELPRSLTLIFDDSEWGHGPKKKLGPVLQFHQEGVPGRLAARPLVFGYPLPPAAAAELDEVADRYVADLLSRL